MSLSRAPEVQQVSSILWVDAANLVDPVRQDGTIERPYSTIQQAIDHAVASGTTSWNIQITFGDYSAQALTIPSGFNFVIDGRTKRGPNSTMGPITWTVTGNNTSGITFRRIIVGAITINDDVSPATSARLAFSDCEVRGITVTGSSLVGATIGGFTAANFAESISNVVASVVTGDIDLGIGPLLLTQTQCQNTCTFIRANTIFANGSSFAQDIEVTGPAMQVANCTFAGTAHTITSTNATQSDALVDLQSSVSFVDNGWTQSNFAIKISSFESTGLSSGGLVTRDTGRTVDVSAGAGLIFHESESATRYVTWVGGSLTIPANSLHDIYVDDTGTILSATHPINHRNGILLATVSTNATDVTTLSAEQVSSQHSIPQFSEYTTKLFGSLHVSGLVTTVYSPPSLQLQVDSGSFYNGIHLNTLTAASPITFTYWYRQGGGWTQVTGQTDIDSGFYDDGSGTLATLSPGQWKKDAVFVSQNDSGTEYHVIYAQEYYDSQAEAVAGNIPTAPEQVLTTSLRIAGAVVEGGSTEVSVVVDLRPKLGQLSSGSTAVSDHGLLSGLSDNDHPQYQLTSEKNAANGYAGLTASTKIVGSQQTYGNTTNTAVEGNDSRVPTQGENDALIGTNGVPSGSNPYVTDSDPRNTNARTPTAHATTHLPSGSDPLAIGTPVTITALTNANGTANSFSRSDHQHAHGVQTDSTLHAVATTSLPGFMSAADKTKLDGLPTNAQPLDSDLTALANTATTGLYIVTGVGTSVTRSLTQPAAGLTISNNDGVAGSPTFALANDLLAVESLATTGLAIRTATDTWVTRTITGTAGNLTVTNGDGVSGNPTLNLATVSQGSGGSFVKVTLDGFGRVTQNTPVVSGDITTALGFTPVSGPAGADTQVQFNNAGVFGAASNFTFTPGANPFVSIIGTDLTNQLRVGGSADIGTAAFYVEASTANQEGIRFFLNSGTPATSAWVSLAYSGSQPYLRLTDADDDPPYVSFDVIGSGTFAAPQFANRFGGRGPNAGATTGFSWYVNGTEISQLDTNYWLEPTGTTGTRPGTPVNGMQRYNTTLNKFEGYQNGAWTSLTDNTTIQLTATANTTTTSGTFVTIAGMTTTPPAGTYYVSFSARIYGTNTGQDIEYCLALAGANIAHTVRGLDYNSAADADDLHYSAHTQAIIVCNGSQVVDARWATNAGTNNCEERSLIFIKVA